MGERRPKIALTVAGFDPSSGAGVTADLQTFAAHGVFGTCAVTALTVQSTLGVDGVEPVRPELLQKTLDCIWEDLPPEAIKLGMLGDAGLVRVIAAFLKDAVGENSSNSHIPLVFDPVLRSSSGAVLTGTDQATLRAVDDKLLPLVSWVTPNWAELAILAGVPVSSEESAAVAADRLGERHPHLHIVATGGDGLEPVDLLRLPDGSFERFAGERVETSSTHGTGCAFSAALLCRLLHRDPPAGAVQGAKQYVTEALRRAPGLGRGRGPLNLLWPLQESRSA